MKGRRLFYLVLDGFGDEPSPALHGKTPLGWAAPEHMNRLAREGEVYRLSILDRDGTASTHSGQLSLLGYPPDGGLPRRGPIEAAATGLELRAGDIALRGNFATLDEHGRLSDRRAGRIREGAIDLCQALDGLDLGDSVTALVRNATEHRLAIVLRGPGLDARICDTDPKSLACGPTPPLPAVPLAPEAAFAADKLRRFLSQASRILERHPVNDCRRMLGLPPANTILTRQAGGHLPLPSIAERFGLSVAAAAGEMTILGLCRLLGIEAHTRPGFTANVDTDLAGKFELALELLRQGHDLAMLHVKATDILAHDRNPQGKADFIRKVDRALGRTLSALPPDASVAIASDHSTSSVTGDHLLTFIPSLLWGPGVPPSRIEAFDEAGLEACGAPLLLNDAYFLRLWRHLRPPAPA